MTLSVDINTDGVLGVEIFFGGVLGCIPETNCLGVGIEIARR